MKPIRIILAVLCSAGVALGEMSEALAQKKNAEAEARASVNVIKKELVEDIQAIQQHVRVEEQFCRQTYQGNPVAIAECMALIDINACAPVPDSKIVATIDTVKILDDSGNVVKNLACKVGSALNAGPRGALKTCSGVGTALSSIYFKAEGSYAGSDSTVVCEVQIFEPSANVVKLASEAIDVGDGLLCPAMFLGSAGAPPHFIFADGTIRTLDPETFYPLRNPQVILADAVACFVTLTGVSGVEAPSLQALLNSFRETGGARQEWGAAALGQLASHLPAHLYALTESLVKPSGQPWTFKELAGCLAGIGAKALEPDDEPPPPTGCFTASELSAGASCNLTQLATGYIYQCSYGGFNYQVGEDCGAGQAWCSSTSPQGGHIFYPIGNAEFLAQKQILAAAGGILPETLVCGGTGGGGGGGPVDSDFDGVPDQYDNCPFQHGDFQCGGCPCGPQSDSDGDGVFDSIDPCPFDYCDNCGAPGVNPRCQ